MNLLLSVLLTLTAQDAWFDHPEVLLSGNEETFRALEDFDLDGRPDLFGASEPGIIPAFVSLRLNDGSGRFGAPFIIEIADASALPSAPAVGDFDGDGFLDVAFEVLGLDLVSRAVFLRGTGTGVFEAPVTIAGAQPDGGVVAMEFDGDSAPELAMSTETGAFLTSTFVYDWNGIALVEVMQGPVFLGSAYPLLSPDLDGDGLDELFTSDEFATRVLPNLGGFFGAPKVVQVGSRDGIHQDQLGISFGDLDGDGDLDLINARTAWPTTSIEVLENVGGTTFTPLWSEDFQLPGSGFSADGPASLAVVDWNGDGLLDVAGQSVVELGMTSPEVPAVLFLGLGDGSFQDPLWLPTLGARPLAGVGELAVGHTALVTAKTIVADDAAFNLAEEAAALVFHAEHIVDLDMDGDPDLHLTPTAMYPSETYAVNDGTGALREVPFFAPGALDPGGVVLQPHCRGDFDGDGRPEFVGNLLDVFGAQQTLLGLWRYELTPGLGFTNQGQAGAAIPFVYFENFAADVDGDGHLDLVDGNEWRPGDGAGGFGSPLSAFTEIIYDVADVDGDGDPDCLAYVDGGFNNDDLVLRSRTSTGYDVQILLQAFRIHRWASFLDIDGDGDPDVVASTSSGFGNNERIAVFENVGGFLSQVADLEAAAPDEIHGFALDDVDGDGTPDLLALSGGSLAFSYQRLFAFPRVPGSLNFGPPREYLTWFGGNLADADSDGDIDMLGSDTTRGLRFVLPASGQIHQYGAGTPGTGGAAPLLNATGPLRPESTQAGVRLVGAVGGALGALAIGSDEALLSIVGLPLYISSFLDIQLIQLGGVSGVVGDGDLTLPLPNPVGLAGLTIFLQVFAFDPGVPGSITASNGLQMSFGN